MKHLFIVVIHFLVFPGSSLPAFSDTMAEPLADPAALEEAKSDKSAGPRPVTGAKSIGYAVNVLPFIARRKCSDSYSNSPVY